MVDTLNGLIADIQNYVVSPLNAFGAGGFVFDLQGESMATLSADITDHYSEDNRALQDHIAIKPKKITLKGYVGELIFNGSGSDNSFLAQPTQKLTEISAFLPELSSAATQIQELIGDPTASTITLSSASDIYSLVKNSIGAFGNTQNQQGAYQFFAACQLEGILMGIQTPWEFLSNMAVEIIVAIQSEDSIFMTDFAVTFKQIRIASTLTAASPLTGTGGTVAPGGTFSQAVASLQGQFPTNNGIVPGLGLPYSGLPGAQAGIISTSSLLNNSLANIFRMP